MVRATNLVTRTGRLASCSPAAARLMMMCPPGGFLCTFCCRLVARTWRGECRADMGISDLSNFNFKEGTDWTPHPFPSPQRGEGVCFLFCTQGGAHSSLTLGYYHATPMGFSEI